MLLEKQRSKMHIVVTFLAVLELMKTGMIRVYQEEICGGDPDRFPDITEHKSMSGETGRKEKEWSKKKLQAAIEAILFAMGGSVELKKTCTGDRT